VVAAVAVDAWMATSVDDELLQKGDNSHLPVSVPHVELRKSFVYV